MPNFKPKTNKKIKFNKKTAITLDTKHKEFLNEFNKDDNSRIPGLKFERSQIKQKLIEENEILTIEQRLDLQDKVNETLFNIMESGDFSALEPNTGNVPEHVNFI